MDENKARNSELRERAERERAEARISELRERAAREHAELRERAEQAGVAVAGDSLKRLPAAEQTEPQYRPEKTRADRAWNAAAFLVRLHERLPSMEGVAIARMRREVRQELGLPELEGELLYGDLRATGDAIGRHFLNLNINTRKGVRVVMLCDANVARCRDYLAGRDAQDDHYLM